MDRFGPNALRMEIGGRVVLYNRQTGRHHSLSAETLAELERWTPGLAPPPALGAVAARLEGLGLLRESPPADVAHLVPVRSRLVLLIPDEGVLWFPVPTHRTPGGFGYAARPVSAQEQALWRGCNGARTVADVAEMAGCALPAAVAFCATLTGPDVQALQLRLDPIDRRDAAPARLVAPDRPPAPRPDHLYGDGGQTSLQHYHLQIADGQCHFDDRETTVAHAFAVPHPALGGQRYGTRLHQAMESRGLLPVGDDLTLEVGPGTGELCAAWSTRAAQRGLPRGEYVRLDSSPELLATQDRRQPGTRGILGSATELPFSDASVGLVLCNEVMADLTAVPLDAALPDLNVEANRAVIERLDRYGIEPLPGRCWYNLGAWKLLEEIARVLAPGGAAFLSEFGELDAPPEETVQLDHPEVSIHFGHLQAVARGLGLHAECVPLCDFLGFDLHASWLARHSFESLRARLAVDGHSLAARAWTEASMELPWAVEGLDWVPVSQPGPGPVVTRFQALILRQTGREG